MAAQQRLFVGTANGAVIYIAADGTWQRSSHSLEGIAVRAVQAADADTLLVGSDAAQAYQSFDGGQHWSSSASSAPQPLGLQVLTLYGPAPLAFPRLMGATAYARLSGKHGILLGAGAGGSLLFRSFDDGIHWEPAHSEPEQIGRVSSLAPARDQSAAAWAGTELGELLRSDDQGQSWYLLAREPVAILCLLALDDTL